MRCKKLFPPSSSCSRVPEAKQSPPSSCGAGPGAGPVSWAGGGPGQQRRAAVFFPLSTKKCSTHFWKFIFYDKILPIPIMFHFSLLAPFGFQGFLAFLSVLDPLGCATMRLWLRQQRVGADEAPRVRCLQPHRFWGSCVGLWFWAEGRHLGAPGDRAPAEPPRGAIGLLPCRGSPKADCPLKLQKRLFTIHGL